MIIAILKVLSALLMRTPKTKPAAAEQVDVDMRFLLANERTLLAWIRTSLALQAAGVAIVHFDKSNHHIYGIAVIIVGALAALAGFWRYRAADRAIRLKKLSNIGRGPLLITLAVIAIAVGALLVYS